MILIILKKSLTLWKDFINAHGRAVVTLTQVDTKLIQLELLDKSDNGEEGNARVMEKNLGNLQVTYLYNNKYNRTINKTILLHIICIGCIRFHKIDIILFYLDIRNGVEKIWRTTRESRCIRSAIND